MRFSLLRGVAASFAVATLLLAATPASAQTTQLKGVVNINLANVEQLQMLPTIGPARAAAIIEYRVQHGPFEKVDGLLEVSGIGDKALERIQPHCVLRGKTTATLDNP